MFKALIRYVPLSDMVALFGDVLRPMKWCVFVVILHSQATKCLLNSFLFLWWWPRVLSGRLYWRGGYVQIGRGRFFLLWKDRLEYKSSKFGLKLIAVAFFLTFSFSHDLDSFDHNLLQLVLTYYYISQIQSLTWHMAHPHAIFLPECQGWKNLLHKCLSSMTNEKCECDWRDRSNGSNYKKRTNQRIEMWPKLLIQQNVHLVLFA